jgi:hypothetical protein
VTRRYNDPIEVECAEDQPGMLRPLAFFWRGRRYGVVGLLKYWREAGEAWEPQRTRDHECFRVEAEGGVYDLRFDRLAASSGPQPSGPQPSGPQPVAWRLARVWD